MWPSVIPASHTLHSWGRIYKRLRSPGIDSASLAGRYDKEGCPTGPPAGNRLLGSLKGLQIRVLRWIGGLSPPPLHSSVLSNYLQFSVCKSAFGDTLLATSAKFPKKYEMNIDFIYLLPKIQWLNWFSVHFKIILNFFIFDSLFPKFLLSFFISHLYTKKVFSFSNLLKYRSYLLFGLFLALLRFFPAKFVQIWANLFAVSSAKLVLFYL